MGEFNPLSPDELVTAAEPLLRSEGEGFDSWMSSSPFSFPALDCKVSMVAESRLLVDAGGVGPNNSSSVKFEDPRLFTSAELFAN